MAVIRKKHTYLRTFTRRKEREKGNKYAKLGMGVVALVPVVFLLHRGRGFERLNDFIRTFAETSFKKEAQAFEPSLSALGPLEKIKDLFMKNPQLGVIGTVSRSRIKEVSVKEAENKLYDVMELLRMYYSEAEIRKLFNDRILKRAYEASRLVVDEEKRLLYIYDEMAAEALRILTETIRRVGHLPQDSYYFDLLSKYLPTHVFPYLNRPGITMPLMHISSVEGQFARIFEREIKSIPETEVLFGQHIERVIKEYVHKHVFTDPVWKHVSGGVFKNLTAEERLQIRNLVTKVTEEVAKWLHHHAGIEGVDFPQVDVAILAREYYNLPMLVAQISVVDLRGVKRTVEVKLGVPQKGGLMEVVGGYPSANVKFAQGNRIRSVFSLKVERLGEMFEHALNDLYEGKSEDYVLRRIERIIGHYDLYGTGRNDKIFQLTHSIVDRDMRDYAAYSAKKRFLKRAADLLLGMRKGKYKVFMDAEWIMAGVSSTGTQYAVTESRRRLIWSFAIQVFDDSGREVDKLVVFIDPKTVSDTFFLSQVQRYGLSREAAVEALRAVRGRIGLPAGYIRVDSEMEASRLICKKLKDIINKYGKDDLLVMGKNFWSTEVALLERAFKADSQILTYIKKKLIDIEDIYRLVYGARAVDRSLRVESIIDFVKATDEGAKLLNNILNYRPDVEAHMFGHLVRSLHFGEQDNRIAFILTQVARSMVQNDPELRDRLLRIYDIIEHSQDAVLSFTTQQRFMQNAFDYLKATFKTIGVGSPNAARKWRFEFPFNPAHWTALFIPTIEKQRYQLGRGLPLTELTKKTVEELKKEYARTVLGMGAADINYMAPAMMSMPFKEFLSAQMLHNIKSIFYIPTFATFFPFAGEGHLFMHQRLGHLSTVVKEVIARRIPITKLDNMDARAQLWMQLFQSVEEAIKTSPKFAQLIKERFNNDIVRFVRALDLSLITLYQHGILKEDDTLRDLINVMVPDLPLHRLEKLTIKQYFALRGNRAFLKEASEAIQFRSKQAAVGKTVLGEFLPKSDLFKWIFVWMTRSGLYLTNPEQYARYGTFVMTDRLRLGDQVVKIGYNGQLLFNKVVADYNTRTGYPTLDVTLHYEIVLPTPLKFISTIMKGIPIPSRWSLKDFPYYLIEPARFFERGELGLFIEAEMQRLKEGLLRRYNREGARIVMEHIADELNDYMKRIISYAQREFKLPLRMSSPLFVFNPKMLTIEGHYDLFNDLTMEQQGLLWTLFLEGLPEKVGKIGGFPDLFSYLENKFAKHGITVTSRDRELLKRYVHRQYSLYKNRKMSEKEFFETVFLKNIANERIRNYFSRIYYGNHIEQLGRLFDFYAVKFGEKAKEEILIGLGFQVPHGLGDTALTSTYKSFVRIPMQMYWDIHRWPHLVGMARFVDAFQAHNLPLYETLLKMADMLKMTQSSVEELIKEGDVYAVPIKRFFQFIRKNMNLLRMMREDIYVPEKILEEAHGDFVHAVQMMLNAGVSLTDFKEGAIKFEGAQIRAEWAKRVQEFLNSIFEEAQGKRVVIDVGRAMSMSYKNLEAMIGQNDYAIRDLIKYLERMGYNKVRYVPLGVRDFWKMAFHQISREQVIIEPHVKQLLKLMASIASVMGKVQGTGVPSQQVKFEERNVLYKQFVNYLASITSTFIGRQSLWARTAVTNLPGVEGVGLPSFVLFNKANMLHEVVWEPFTTYVDANVIKNMKDMLKAAGFSERWIEAFYKGSPNVAFLGMPGRMPFHPGMGIVGLIKSLTKQQKERMSSISDMVKIYMDPLLITKVLLGDWDTDRLMALLDLTSPKGSQDIIKIWKWIYGLTDEDISFLMSYGYFKAGYRRGVAELQTYFTSVFEKLTAEQKKAYMESNEFRKILDKRLSAVLARMKEGYLSWFGKTEMEELKDRIIMFATGDVVKIPTTEGKVIILPRILVKMRGYSMKMEEMWPFVSRAKDIARKEGISLADALSKVMAEEFSDRVLRNVKGTAMAGAVDVMRTGYSLLLSEMYKRRAEGLSYQDISRVLGLSIPESFGHVFDLWMKAGAEGQKMVLTFEREILDKVLKMKRGGSPEAMAEAISNLARELLAFSREGSTVAKKGNELIERFLGEIDWKKLGMTSHDALYMLGWLLRNTQWAIQNSSYTVTRRSINRGMLEALSMFASKVVNNPSGPVIGSTLLDELSNEVLRSMASEPKSVQELLMQQSGNMRFREAIAGFLSKSFENLARSKRSRLLLAGLLAGMTSYIMSGPKLRGDIFSFGINLGRIHGLEPSFFDGRWTYPELPVSEDIRGIENPYHKRKIYILRNIKRRSPALFNALRRRGIIQEWEMFTPYDYPRQNRKVVYV